MVPDPQNTENTESKKVTAVALHKTDQKEWDPRGRPLKTNHRSLHFAEKATHHKAAPDVQPTADWCTERGYNRRGTSLKYAENREIQHKP